MTLVNCSLQSKPHLAVCSQLVTRCPASSHTNIIFSFEGKREPSAVCKPQHHPPLPHKPQIKGLHFLNHRGVPGAPRSRCLALYFLLDTKTVQLLQYMVEGKTMPIRYPTYISKKYKNTQSLISACRRRSKNWGEQVKIVTQLQCGALAHKFGQKHHSKEEKWASVPWNYSRIHQILNLTPTLLLFRFHVTMMQLSSIWNIYERLNMYPFWSHWYLLKPDKILKQQFQEAQTTPFISLSGSLAPDDNLLNIFT